MGRVEVVEWLLLSWSVVSTLSGVSSGETRAELLTNIRLKNGFSICFWHFNVVRNFLYCLAEFL